jgi:hypothetical protein
MKSLEPNNSKVTNNMNEKSESNHVILQNNLMSQEDIEERVENNLKKQKY